MLNEDACTRFNRAMTRSERTEQAKDRLKVLGLILLFFYVVWDCGHYEPDSEVATHINYQH